MIPVFKPNYGNEELEALKEPFSTGWIGLGPKTKEFESKFASYIGCKHAIGVNSATAALHLAMKVMGVEDREVITTSMTFISTNHAILYNNAVPVFCDIEPDSLNIDTTKIESLITNKTKAIVVVHYGGYAVDLDPVLEIAKNHNLKLVEDAAHAAGGEYKGKKLGSIGDIGCFSFHAVKNLACGEGGMITTNDDKIDKLLRRLRWMGITKDTYSRDADTHKGYSWYYDVAELGFKCHMNDIPAAIGIVQLRKLEKSNARRAELVARYNDQLAGVGDVELPICKSYMTKPAYHNYVIKSSYRDKLNEYLKEKGISTGVHYYPNHLYDMYKPYYRHLPVTETIWKKLLTLPLFPDLTNDQQDSIIDGIKRFFKQ
ncbi:MAG: DegT/DnrJ/EryC1/StrS family aminotransferase [Bacteroidota bacterium]|jgi:perosamine synthetase